MRVNELPESAAENPSNKEARNAWQVSHRVHHEKWQKLVRRFNLL